MCAWQMRIRFKIKPWRTSLNARQTQLFDSIEADRAETDGLGNGGSVQILFEHFHETQHLDELALALVARSTLH